MKKILVVDDSALMRRVLCDIIKTDPELEVTQTASDGLEALEILKKTSFDAVVCDVNMPKMSGLGLLKELQKNQIPARVMMASTDTKEGSKTALDALDLGALDFVHKPDRSFDCRNAEFQEEFLRTLHAVSDSKAPTFQRTTVSNASAIDRTRKLASLVKKSGPMGGKSIVAIASSTGGPKALQSVIPRLPANLDAPVLLVQHMPVGFTKTLADRLNAASEITVKEAEEGEILTKGCVYLSKGGMHMNVVPKNGNTVIHYSNEPIREGVKPCANYMYESLVNCSFDNIVGVVMTGMGADGTAGMKNLKNAKKVHVIAQEETTCAVYGMPKAIVKEGLSDQIVPLEQIAQEIILHTGVN